jgi:hypothetical protein
LWTATLSGLDVLQPDGKKFVHYRHDAATPTSLSHSWAIALHKSRKGDLWIGTYGGGLNLFDPRTGTFRAYKEVDGLPSNAVYAILEDKNGRLWLSTNKGLCRFDPATGTAEAFDLTNGLQSLQFNLGAALQASDGAMLFGGGKGFYYFDPERITPNPHVPPVVFTALKVLNQPRKTDTALSRASEIRLRYDDKIISLEFAVLDYTFPRRNAYAYQLEGFNDRWVSLGGSRSVTFTNLDPGSYVLRVKASNSDGVWSEVGTSLRLVIPPPFWATWWWRIFCVLAFVGLLVSAHRLRVRHLEKRERELEARVEDAMSRVKVLKGLLPICATCKKVRDDRGYWNQIESYIRDRSEADFSHGICPDCIARYYPEYRGAEAKKS